MMPEPTTANVVAQLQKAAAAQAKVEAAAKAAADQAKSNQPGSPQPVSKPKEG